MGHHNVYEEVSSRFFRYALMNTRDIRTRYRNVAIDIPHSVVNTSPRNHMIRILVEQELGKEKVADYLEMANTWREYDKYADIYLVA